jgi:hypothetical protein
MKNYLPLLVILLLSLQGCAPWKTGLINHGNYDIAIKNAVLDFSNTTTLVRQDSAFSVDFKDFDSGIIGVSILGTIGKFIVIADDKSSRLPTRYLEYNGKLFYWYDEKYTLEKDVVNKLDKYNLIDSVETIAQAVFVHDDTKKGVNYYFCNNNLFNYKKIITTKALEYCELPKLNCTDK